MTSPNRVIWALFLGLSLLQGATASLCKRSVLNFYGLKGLYIAQPHRPAADQPSQKNCPRLRSTCCSSEDWAELESKWAESVETIKSTLAQLYSVFQIGNEIQTSIIKLLPKLVSRKGEACKKIDYGFFRNQLPFELVDFRIKSAFQVLAHLQKGFPCMICDAEAHPHFDFGARLNRYLMRVAPSTCTNLMKYFRDFLEYKFYFFDPMLINLNQVVNCANDNEALIFDNWYRSDYQTMNDCLLHGDNCEDVCAEFSLGVSGNLFAGDLRRYKKTLEALQKALESTGHQVDLMGDLPADPSRAEFFGFGEEAKKYPSGNLTRYNFVFLDKGLDFFRYAAESRYSLGPQSAEAEPVAEGEEDTRDQQQGHKTVIPEEPEANNGSHPTVVDDDSPKTVISEDDQLPTVTEPAQAEKIHQEAEKKMQDMEKANKAPLPSEVSGMTGNIDTLEAQFIQSLNQQAA